MKTLEALQATAAKWLDVDEHVAKPYWEMKANESNEKAIAEFLRIAAAFYPIDEINKAIAARGRMEV